METLKESLKRVDKEIPYRGPTEYRYGKMDYFCTVRGDMNFFNGEEKICYENMEVYKLYFHGGRILG